MRLEKIELIGFKSFAERTAIEFHPGITCIVGPNGCGKSNIVDAFRWVLGEQSAKVLRGDSMQEVIFNGSETKKPRGMAEVNLYFSFPEPEGNGNEVRRTVVVSRRLYRSGESEYLINKNPCRLKDIRDLFLDTGLEVRSYSILEQGSVGQIINAKPQDRRFLIEEVAGVMKYKVRRAEAETKLQNAKLNLQRVQDILSEVKRQRNSLQRQAKKVERYMEIKKALNALEIKVARARLSQLRKELHKAIESLNRDSSEEVSLRTEVTHLETELQKKKTLYSEKHEEVTALEQKMDTLEDEIKDREKRLELIDKERSYLNEQIGALKASLGNTETEITETEKRIKYLEDQFQEIEAQKARYEEDYQNLTARAEALRAKIQSHEKELDELRKSLFDRADQIGQKRNEVNRASFQIQQNQKRLQQIERQAEEARRRRAELSEELREIEKSYEEFSERLDTLRKERSLLYESLQDIKTQLQDALNRKVQLKESLASLNARYTSLKERIYGKVEIEKLQSQGVRVLGSLSQIIEVPEELEKPVEAALLDKASALVLENQGSLIKAVSEALGDGTERVTFIVPGAIPDVLKSSHSNSLSSMVRVEDKYRPLVEALLGDCLLCDDLEDAIEKTKDTSLRAVTRDGVVVQWGALVTAGRPGEVLTLTRLLKDIQREIEQNDSELSQLDKMLEDLQSKEEELKGRIRQTESEIVNIEKRMSFLESDINRRKEEIERFDKKISLLSEEKIQVDEETASLEEETKKLNDELEVLTREKDKIQQKTETLTEELNIIKGSYQRLSEEISEVRSSLEGLKERSKACVTQQAELREKLKSLEGKIRVYTMEIEQKTEKLGSLSEEENTIRSSLKELINETDSLRGVISEKHQALKRLSEEISTSETVLKELQKRLQGATTNVYESQMKKRELELKIEGLLSSVRERLAIDIGEDTTEEIEVSPEEETEIERMKEQLQSMEPVNLAAIDEFKEVEERFQFLTQQHQDITQSIEELEDAIHRIDRTTRTRLKEAYEALNLKFQEVFQRLFDGGTAELRLTSEDILEAGIEIVAQPPGKKLQNINLLSGGEKAMTALALMFGGFLIKPSPICILDEADAPLDENNTYRFVEMLRDLSRDIQFIVITHNRQTMEAADYLYGVTMEEPGVTKIISYRLAEAG